MVAREDVAAERRVPFVPTVHVDGAPAPSVADLRAHARAHRRRIVATRPARGVRRHRARVDGEIAVERSDGAAVRRRVPFEAAPDDRRPQASVDVDGTAADVGAGRRARVARERRAEDVEHGVLHVDGAAPCVGLEPLRARIGRRRDRGAARLAVRERQVLERDRRRRRPVATPLEREDARRPSAVERHVATAVDRGVLSVRGDELGGEHDGRRTAAIERDDPPHRDGGDEPRFVADVARLPDDRRRMGDVDRGERERAREARWDRRRVEERAIQRHAPTVDRASFSRHPSVHARCRRAARRSARDVPQRDQRAPPRVSHG